MGTLAPVGQRWEEPREDESAYRGRHCPVCNSLDVSRMYLATQRFDACECGACAARWDEYPDHTVREADLRSVLGPRPR